MKRLTALAVSRATAKGMYADGGGLYLQVTASGVRSWIYRFMLNGRAHEMGLGPLHAVNLAEAREKARHCRQLRADGIDPIAARSANREREKIEAEKQITFQDGAEIYLNANEAGWRNAKHAKQWRATLKAYAYPVLGSVPIGQIDVGLVMKTIEPIWITKTETASRVRQRIECVLDWATARGYRQGENPARWRGLLQKLLPKRGKAQCVRHFPALAYADAGSFIALLRKHEGMAVCAMEFLILTATRTSETIAAKWTEIDLDQAVWTIPANRIKAGKQHRVPLSAAALSLLKRVKEVSHGEYVFPGQRKGKHLSNMALLATLKRMSFDHITVHGFRSTFRDWAAETTNHPRDVVEMALAHAIGDKVEAAYRRGDLFAKRKRLMDQWAAFCTKPSQSASVTVLRGTAARDAAQ